MRLYVILIGVAAVLAAGIAKHQRMQRKHGTNELKEDKQNELHTKSCRNVWSKDWGRI